MLAKIPTIMLLLDKISVSSIKFFILIFFIIVLQSKESLASIRDFMKEIIPIKVNNVAPIQFKIVAFINIFTIFAKYMKIPESIDISKDTIILYLTVIFIFFIPNEIPRAILSMFAEITNKSDNIKLVNMFTPFFNIILNENNYSYVIIQKIYKYKLLKILLLCILYGIIR